MSDEIVLPTPLRDWVLVRREKKGGSLILPDASQESYEFYADACGPEVEGIEPGDRLQFLPRAALANSVMINDSHSLVSAGGVIGIYRSAQ